MLPQCYPMFAPGLLWGYSEATPGLLRDYSGGCMCVIMVIPHTCAGFAQGLLQGYLG